VIVGIGIDVVDVPRFEATLARTPGLLDRVFAPEERVTDAGHPRTATSLAARFAAKEAIAKALGAPVGLAWHDAEVVSEETGRPRFDLRGTVAAQAEAMGATSVHVSLSHDAGIASAVVVLEG
jgi:holo-[acyl-carrier protein] synthase